MKRLLAIIPGVMVVTVLGCANAGASPGAINRPHLAVTRTTTAPTPVLGVDVEADVAYQPATAASYGQRLATYVRQSLDAKSLGIVWDLCDPSFTSDTVSQCAESLSPASVAAVVHAATRAGLTVVLRPLIRVGAPSLWGNPSESWEGFIQPANQKAWFASLLGAEKPYLSILKGVRSASFVAATEPYKNATSPWWSWLLQQARDDCGCTTSIASYIAEYRENVFPANEMQGVDWYDQLSLKTNASQAAVTAAWESGFAKISPSLLARTTLDEEGIRATAGAYGHPEDWFDGGPSAPQVQVRWFTAACRTVLRYHMRGMYFYKIPLDDDPAHPFSFPAYFVGNAGSQAIRGCAQMFKAVGSHA